MAEKKRYYVSVQAMTVMEQQGEAAYELEIEATPDEVEVLLELFESKSDADFRNYIRMHNPQVIWDEIIHQEMHDVKLAEAYRLIHKLGTPETKRHVESMNVLQGINKDKKAKEEQPVK